MAIAGSRQIGSASARADQKYAEQSRPTEEPRPAWMSDPRKLPRKPPPMRFAEPRGSRRDA